MADIVFIISPMDPRKPKYTTMLTPDQIGFMEYYMLPEKDQFEYVYRPGDDSFLMLSVLKNQYQSFPHNPIICEIGTGSGILSAHLNKWLVQNNNPPAIHIGTDVNLDACLLSRKYYEHYGLEVEQVCTSLFKGLNLKPQIVVCNPPYVLTDPTELESERKYMKQKLQAVRERGDITRSHDRNLIAYSYMGGPEGLDTTRLLIKSIQWQTKLYLIVMGEEGLEILTNQVQNGKIVDQKLKAKVQVLQFMKKMNEELYVILITTVYK